MSDESEFQISATAVASSKSDAGHGDGPSMAGEPGCSSVGEAADSDFTVRKLARPGRR